VKLVQSWGVKIDGVGLQGHLVSEPTGTQSVVTPSTEVLTQVLQDYADLGVDVAYTELDIRMRTPSNAQKLQAQADAYARVAQSCLNVERCVGITLWVCIFPAPLTLQVWRMLTFLRVSPTGILGFPRHSMAKATLYSGTITTKRSPPIHHS
jgi:endo-1,4-beta-xylanase